jgi:ammonium transporter, Amt family
LSRAISALAPLHVDLQEIAGCHPVGRNPGHDNCIEEIRAAGQKLYEWQSFIQSLSPKKPSKKPKKSGGERKDSMAMQGSVFGRNRVSNRNSLSQVDNNGFEGQGRYIATDTINEAETISRRVDGGGNTNPNFAWIE